MGVAIAPCTLKLRILALIGAASTRVTLRVSPVLGTWPTARKYGTHARLAGQIRPVFAYNADNHLNPPVDGQIIQVS